MSGTAHERVQFYAWIGLFIAVLLVTFDLARTSTNPLNLVQPGEQGPSAEVFHEDFPGEELLTSSGLDGQQFYAVARNPFNLDEAAEQLDRPRYRLQRPLLSWLAWIGHPSGGGPGLIWSLVVLNAIATWVLAVATGSISVRLGGPPWVAALVGLYPGVWWSLRVTVADTLATALAFASIALLLHHRTRWAVLAAVGAVLAKETAALILIGWAIGRRRDRTRWYPVIGAGVVAVAWMVYLRLRLPGSEAVGEVTVPFVGLYEAIVDRWLESDELWGLVGTVSGLAVGIAALIRRGVRHPLAPAMILQLVFLAFANGDVLGNSFGGGRALLPLLGLGTIALLAPGGAGVPDDRTAPVVVSPAG